MKISGFGTQRINNRLRASATVTWEDSPRDELTVFFETDDPRGLACNPHAFLLACTVPAIHYGERRIYLDAPLCPELKDGVTTVASILQDWHYRGSREPLRVEARAVMKRLAAPSVERAGMFFSGGVDAFATLRLNRQGFPVDHPRSIKEGILVFGFEQDDPEKFEYVRKHLEGAADVCELSLLPVYTNIYLPYRAQDARQRFRFWEFEYEGSALAAVAHSLVQRLSVVSISATESHRTLGPLGSHPMIDPNLGSTEMKIQHTGILLSRFEKVRLIADWDAILPFLRVCNRYAKYRPGAFNCGVCEKCIRTKLEFLAVDKRRVLEVFTNSDVTADFVEQHLNLARNPTAARLTFYQELLPALSQRGQRDLVRVIERKLAQARKWMPTGVYGKVRRLLRRAQPLLRRSRKTPGVCSPEVTHRS